MRFLLFLLFVHTLFFVQQTAISSARTPLHRRHCFPTRMGQRGVSWQVPQRI